MKKKYLFFPFWNKYFSLKEQRALFVIVVIGTILRVINAIYTPLWRDEIYIFFTARENSLWKLITQQHWDTAHPPLHSIFLHFWQMISIQPLWLRLPSLIASFFILYLIPILAIKITNKYKIFPFIFLFLFCISHTQISLNMVVRPYPFVILLTIASLILFMTMLDNQLDNGRNIVYFALINWIMVLLDYSAFWLFSAYLFFFPFYAFFSKSDKVRIIYVFKALALSALCSLTVLPFLFGNLANSLYLERYIEPIKYEKGTIDQGKPMYIMIKRDKKKITIYNEKLVAIDSTTLPFDPFPQNKIYAGLNLSPLSILSIANFSICPVSNSITLTETIKNLCQEKPTLSPIGTRIVKHHFSYIFDFYIGKIRNILNVRFSDWETNLFTQHISIKKNDDIFIAINLTSNYLLYPTGINIFGKQQTDNIDWWRGITRFTISPSEGQYRILFYDGFTNTAQNIFGDRGFFEKFREIFLFMTGLPDNTQAYFIFIISSFIIGVSQIIILNVSIAKKQFSLLFIFFILFVPALISLYISYYFIPVVVGRNLHIMNISYICSISFLISYLTRGRAKFLVLKLVAVTILTLYLAILVMRFPYVYYIDPPYKIGRVLDMIKDTNTNGQKIILLGNSDFYAPLFHYYILLSDLSKKIYVINLESFSSLKGWTNYLNPKSLSSIYFVQLGQSEKEDGFIFLNIIKNNRCNLKQVKVPYIYFARCE